MSAEFDPKAAEAKEMKAEASKGGPTGLEYDKARAPRIKDLLEDLVGKMEAKVQERHDKLPSNDPDFIRQMAEAEVLYAEQINTRKTCGCARCKLAVYHDLINVFVVHEIIAAAFTKDTSKLQALVDLVEKLKACK